MTTMKREDYRPCGKQLVKARETTLLVRHGEVRHRFANLGRLPAPRDPHAAPVMVVVSIALSAPLGKTVRAPARTEQGSPPKAMVSGRTGRVRLVAQAERPVQRTAGVVDPLDGFTPEDSGRGCRFASLGRGGGGDPRAAPGSADAR